MRFFPRPRGPRGARPPSLPCMQAEIEIIDLTVDTVVRKTSTKKIIQAKNMLLTLSGVNVNIDDNLPDIIRKQIDLNHSKAVNSHKRSRKRSKRFKFSIDYDHNLFPLVLSNHHDECAICFETNSDGYYLELPCDCKEQLNFHERCIIEWLKHDNSCPTCRKALYKKYELIITF